MKPSPPRRGKTLKPMIAVSTMMIADPATILLMCRWVHHPSQMNKSPLGPTVKPLRSRSRGRSDERLAEHEAAAIPEACDRSGASDVLDDHALVPPGLRTSIPQHHWGIGGCLSTSDSIYWIPLLLDEKWNRCDTLLRHRRFEGDRRSTRDLGSHVIGLHCVGPIGSPINGRTIPTPLIRHSARRP